MTRIGRAAPWRVGATAVFVALAIGAVPASASTDSSDSSASFQQAGSATELLTGAKSGDKEIDYSKAGRKALERAQRRYARAVVKHAEYLQQAKKMERKAERLEKAATEAREDLGNMARLAYTTGNSSVGILAGVIDSESPRELFDRASVAARVADHQAGEFDVAEDARLAAIAQREKVNEFLAAAADRLADAEADLKQTRLLAKRLKIDSSVGLRGRPVDLNTKSRWIFPVPGKKIESPAGFRKDPILGGRACHSGSDIPAPMGSAVHAVDDGVVVKAGPFGGYGKYTIVKHSKTLSSVYAHQSAILVKKGDKVKRGEVIGAVGSTGRSTGPHLHLEARYLGEPYNPDGWLKNKPELRVPSC